jgi:hypothetical protein
LRRRCGGNACVNAAARATQRNAQVRRALGSSAASTAVSAPAAPVKERGTAWGASAHTHKESAARERRKSA